MQGLLALALYIGAFLAWVYGVAGFLYSHDYFWAVFCAAFFPAGVIVGVFNFFF